MPGLIQGWQVLIHGWAGADTHSTFLLFIDIPSSPCSMEPDHQQLGCFSSQAACAEGNLYALMLPQLQLVSRVTAFPNVPVQLLCSPDCQWVFASSQNSDLEPKVSAL